jgi:PAS domain S-box-containing protein
MSPEKTLSLDQAMLRIFRGALSSATEEDLVEELTRSNFGFIGEIGPDGVLQHIAISDPGWQQCSLQDKAGHRRPPGNLPIAGLYGWVLKNGKSLMANDPQHHPESTGIPEGHPPLAAFLGVPLIRDGLTIGMIALGNRAGGYRQADVKTVEALAPAIVEAFLRKRSERSLEISERNYRELVENVNSVVLRWKTDGSLSFMNRYGLEFFGYGPGELKNVAILVPQHDSYGIDLTRLVEDITKHPESYEKNVNENVRRDGSRVWMSWTNRAIFDENGVLTEIMAIGTDITSIKQTEEKLLKSEMTLLQAQRIAGLGYWDRNLKTDEVHWSDEIYRIFGLKPGEFRQTYEAFLKCVHPDDRPSVIEAVKATLRDPRDKIDMEYRIVRPDGSERCVIERGEIVSGENGDPAYLIGTILDITDRKTMENNLRSARDELEIRVKERTRELERQANLLELAHDAIIVRDAQDRISFWNCGAEDMYGWKKGEAEGTVSHDLLRTKFPVSLNDTTMELLRSGRWEGELEHTTKDGRHVTVMSRQVLKPDENGQPPSVMEINTDITAARQAEEQLRQSQKMQAIGTLAGGIAHDFNNILAAILGFTEMAIDDTADRPEVARNLQNVLKSSLRARDLVKQILAFSRKTEMIRRPISMTPLVRESLQLLRASIPANIEIQLNVTTGSDTILADPVEIQQIIMNLVTNASLAMEDTGGRLDIGLADIELATDVDEDLREYIQLSVRDTGTGMSPEVARRVFEPFFTTRELSKGTGMGLAIVYGIVKELHGVITLESTPGQGSIFRVNIPRVKDLPVVSKPFPAASPEGRERILFVDDEPLILEWADTTLRKLGYSVVTVSNGTDALTVFSSDPYGYDLVITDQAMPGMTGVELARKLLSIRGTIPIILCTGHSETVSAENAKDSGIGEFLMKPLTRKELAKAIRNILDNKDSVRSEK